MSRLTSDQLTELTQRANARLGEFDCSTMPRLSLGAVRVVCEVFDEWMEEEDAEIVEEYANAREQAYNLGFAAGMRAMRGDNGYTLHRDENGTVSEQTPWARNIPDTYPDGAPRAKLDADDLAVEAAEREVGDDDGDLAGDWPDMPDLEGGIDHFADHPVAGAPEDGDDPAVSSQQSVAAAAPGSSERVNSRTEEEQAEIDALTMGADERATKLREVIHELQMMATNGVMPTMAEWDKNKPEHVSKAAAICARHSLRWSKLAEYARLDFDAKPGPRRTKEPI